MSQWIKDINGKFKRVHKCHCCRRACLVYYHKTLFDYEYGFFGADVYTAKPKHFGAYSTTYQALGIKR